MIEFIKQFPWLIVAGALCQIIAACGAVIIGVVNSKNLRHLDAHINQAKRRGTRVLCPNAKKRATCQKFIFFCLMALLTII